MKKNVLTWNFSHFFIKAFPFTLLVLLTFVFLFVDTSCAWEVDIRDKNSMPQGLVVVDKTQKRLRYFEKHSPLIMLHEYPSIHGENEGDKMMEGDLKTPEGVYFITTKIKMELDFDEYGSQAHALNYPNPVDRLRRKTGGGIWIHSKGSPIKDQTTQGCVAIDLDDIEELGSHLMPGTPVLIAQTVTQDHIIQDGAVSTKNADNERNLTIEQDTEISQGIVQSEVLDGAQENVQINAQNNTQDVAQVQNITNTNESSKKSEESTGFLQNLFGAFEDDDTPNQDIPSQRLSSQDMQSQDMQRQDMQRQTLDEQIYDQPTHKEILEQGNMLAVLDSDIAIENAENLTISQSNLLEEQVQEARQMRRHEKTPTAAEIAMQAEIEAQIKADIEAQHTKTPQQSAQDSTNTPSNTIQNPASNDEHILVKLTQEWNNAWADRSYAFFNFYDKDSYTKAQGQPFSKFYEQKDYLFRSMPWLFISYQDINVLEGPGYWVTWFPQYYRAPNHKTEGIRRLYWQKDESNEYKIVAMEWLPRNLGLDKEFSKHVENTVPHFVEAWRLAWKEADSSSYESFYAIDAQQDGLKGIAPIMDKKTSIWAAKTPTEIVFSNIRIDDRSNAVHVYMNQAYSDSSGYRDYGVKRLVLHPRGSSWIIAQESWSRR